MILLAALPILASCRGDTPLVNGDGLESHRESATIDWFEGDLDAAFATAKSAGKPLFLYWGAEWCPPCHVLKNNIFKRPEFIERMQDFVPVYLDGDTERAQILGEELQVMGYPTVIIFDPLGDEIMRMPSTVSVDQYETVLDSAIATMRPVRDVLDHVLTVGPGAATQDDLRLLAFYSWGQDSRINLSLADKVAAFDRLRLETPENLAIERSRFLGLYLMSLTEQDPMTEGVGTALTESQKAGLREETLAALSEARLRNSNRLWITYYADSIIELLIPEDSPGRELLLTTWQQAADALEAEPSLSVGDRLNATRLKMEIAALTERAQNGDREYEVPVALQDHVRSQASWAMATVTDESELQSVINTLAYLLESAGLASEAEAMLLSRMNDTVAPYYFMSWLARLKEDAGDLESALVWYRKAYDAAQGRYSRFRWGSNYLRRLMALAPDSSEKIEADTVEVLSELLSQEDAFAGGNQARLGGLESALKAWNADGTHNAEVARIRDFVQSSCDRYPAAGETPQQQRCRSFLLPADVGGQDAL